METFAFTIERVGPLELRAPCLRMPEHGAMPHNMVVHDIDDETVPLGGDCGGEAVFDLGEMRWVRADHGPLGLESSEEQERLGPASDRIARKLNRALASGLDARNEALGCTVDYELGGREPAPPRHAIGTNVRAWRRQPHALARIHLRAEARPPSRRASHSRRGSRRHLRARNPGPGDGIDARQDCAPGTDAVDHHHRSRRGRDSH